MTTRLELANKNAEFCSTMIPRINVGGVPSHRTSTKQQHGKTLSVADDAKLEWLMSTPRGAHDHLSSQRSISIGGIILHEEQAKKRWHMLRSTTDARERDAWLESECRRYSSLERNRALPHKYENSLQPTNIRGFQQHELFRPPSPFCCSKRRMSCDTKSAQRELKVQSLV